MSHSIYDIPSAKEALRKTLPETHLMGQLMRQLKDHAIK